MSLQSTLTSLTLLCVPLLGQQTLSFEAIKHIGNQPQEIRRSLGEKFDGSEPYVLSFDLEFQYDRNPNLGGQATGLRFYNESRENATFSTVWKTNEFGGALTFLSSEGNFSVQGDAFNLSRLIEKSDSVSGRYNFVIEVESAPGQNPGQFQSGTYSAVVTDLDSGTSAKTGELSWTTQNQLPQNQFDEFVSFNSSSQIVTSFVSTPVGTVPEPSSALLALSATAFGVLRRRR